MSQTPLVSFCMSTYNRPDILRNQLLQILKQEYKNIEVVISDNDVLGSGREVVNQIGDARLKYFQNSVNLGMVKSFNKSIERSTGEFIVMVTDDDPVYPNMLSVLLSLWEKHPNYGVYAGCGDLIIENKYSQKSLNREIGTNSTILKNLRLGEILEITETAFPLLYLDGFFTNTYILWSCCLIKRVVVLKIGGMPDYGSEFLTDHAFVIAASSLKGMLYTNQSFGGQEIRGDNFGFAFDELQEKYIKTPTLFYNYLFEKIGQNPDWEIIKPKIWQFVGRSWVEYSMMIYKSLKEQQKSTNLFFKQFNHAFSNPHLKKWKFKFYLKTFVPFIFKILIRLKK